ncbi:MAG: hypothetical protein M3O02_05565 [Acidobacteriota bacterium]|nr:hypothetical protein [Acidobacteriota bacterium]
MLAFAVLLLAILSRVLPHAFHAVSWNFTALGGSLLFFGSQLADTAANRTRTAAKLGIAILLLMATDFYLTVFAFGYPFQVRGYVVTWVWYAAVCALSTRWLAKPSAASVIGGVLASATSFFVLSNLTVWAGGALYPRTAAGLAACYAAAVPFYRNDLVSTALTAGALFGLPVLAARIVQSVHDAGAHIEL